MALTIQTISVTADGIRDSWQPDSMWVGPYGTEQEYHYGPSACFGEARDTGVIPEGSDHDFDSEWQPAYGRLSCKGTNYEDMSIHLYYEWRFVY